MVTNQREVAGTDYERPVTTEESLNEHLMWQVNLLHLSDSDRAIALTIIDALNP